VLATRLLEQNPVFHVAHNNFGTHKYRQHDNISTGTRQTLILSNHNMARQVIAFSLSILQRILATFQVGDLVHGQLLLPLLLPTRVVLAVILWVDDTSGWITLEVRDDVAPSLVIVDAQSDDEALPRVGQEAKGEAADRVRGRRLERSQVFVEVYSS